MHRLLWLVGGLGLCASQGCHWIFPYGARPSETGIAESRVIDQLLSDGAARDQPGLDGPLRDGPSGTACGRYYFGLDAVDPSWDRSACWVAPPGTGALACNANETDARITIPIPGPLDCAAGRVKMNAQLTSVSAADACSGASLTLLDDQKKAVLLMGMDYCLKQTHLSLSTGLTPAGDATTSPRPVSDQPPDPRTSHVLALEFQDGTYHLRLNEWELTALGSATLKASYLQLGGWQAVSGTVLYYEVEIEGLPSRDR